MILIPMTLAADEQNDDMDEGSLPNPCVNGQTYHGQGVCLDADYQNEQPPNEKTMPIYYKLLKMDIRKIKEKDKTIELEMKLGRGWQDDRITFNSSFADCPDIACFYLPDLIDKNGVQNLPIWFPSGTKTRNVRQEELEDDPATLIMIAKDASMSVASAPWVIAYSEVKLSLFCDFKFADFPMDTQMCQFVYTNENAKELHLLPYGDEAFLRQLSSELDWDTYNYTALEKDGFEIETSFVHGNDLDKENLHYWGFNVTMRRIISPYAFQYFLPAAAIVGVSQISFIIPPSSIPGRIGLLATLFLTLMNIFINHMVRRTAE